MRQAALICLAFAASAAPRTARSTEAEVGRAAIQRFGCARCHTIPGFTVSAENSCVGCHQKLATLPRTGLRRAPRARHYLQVPDLARVARRLRSDYLARYIADPHDARPHLEETMPRQQVSDADAGAIVAYLLEAAPSAEPAAASPRPEASHVERGRRVFASSGCPSCHLFGNVDFGTGATPEFYLAMHQQAALAPNLRFARDRLDPDVALAWIVDPTSIDPATRMPRPTLPREDAIAVRDFLFLANPGAPVLPPDPVAAADLTPLSRRVRFADVRRIFGRSCIHCHAKTNSMTSTVGLGFRPIGLDLSTYDGILAGALGPDGSRHSIVRSADGATAPLLGRLLRRHAEAPRDAVTVYRDPLTPALRDARDIDAPGMPLGLPPLGRADLEIIATWLLQGARR